jgi:flavin reductase (DIM6/NTAB) family NADH-FMN oxidoreductase RutF
VLEETVFRAAMSRLATGVTVVTTVADDLDHAMTANAVTSVSLAPLLVLVSVERATRFHAAVSAADDFGISVLPIGAVATARWLATSGRPLRDQLVTVAHHRGSSGVALLDDALATLECRTWARYDGGDHELFLGEVVDLALPAPDAAPLLYFRSGYRGLEDP